MMRFNPSVGRRMTACAISLDDPSSQLLPVELDDLDALFKGFADPTRLRVLNALAAGELCVCDLVELLGIAQPAVSRHLAYLRRMRLVEATREWKFAHYRLAEPSNAVHRNLIACVRGCFTGVPSLDAERAAAVVRVRERAQVPC
jgi:ArsR family transcriptional regulator